MGKTLCYDGLGILRKPILVREFNVDGTLGKEVTLEENTTVKIKVFDFYRKGVVVSRSDKKEFFLFFNKDLFEIDFFETTEKVPVNAIFIEKFTPEPLSKIVMIACISGFVVSVLFGIIMGLMTVLVSTGSV